MVMVDFKDGKQFYMDGYLKQNLDFAKSKAKDDWDFVFIVDGKERRGKSVLAQQIAYYVDPTFNIDRICFSAEEFEAKIKASDTKQQAFVFDEAYSDTNSASAMGKIGRALKKTMTEIGQKNLFIFIVLPPFFDLGKYWAMWRSIGLIHVYTGADMERGRFQYYNEEKKKLLYLRGKKEYDYNVTSANFFGRFTNFYTVDVEEYKKRKSDAVYKANTEEVVRSKMDIRHEKQRNILIQFLFDHKFTAKELGTLVSLDETAIYKITEGRNVGTPPELRLKGVTIL